MKLETTSYSTLMNHNLEPSAMAFNGNQYMTAGANSANMIQSNGSNSFKSYNASSVANEPNQASLDYYQLGLNDLQKSHNDRGQTLTELMRSNESSSTMTLPQNGVHPAEESKASSANMMLNSAGLDYQMVSALDFAGYANNMNGSSDKAGGNEGFYYHSAGTNGANGQNQILLDNIYQGHSLGSHQTHHGSLQHHQFGNNNLHHHHAHHPSYYNLNHGNVHQSAALDAMSTASASSSPPLSANQVNIPTSLLANSVQSNYLNGAPISGNHEYLAQHLHDKKHLRASAIKSNGQQLANHQTVKQNYLSSSSSTSSASSVSSHNCPTDIGNTINMISSSGKYYTNGISHDLNAYLSNKNLVDMSMNSNDADDMDNEEDEDEEEDDDGSQEEDDEMSRNCAPNGMPSGEDNVYVNSLFNSPSSLSSSASNPQLELITVAKSMGANYNRRLGNAHMNMPVGSQSALANGQSKKSAAIYSKMRDTDEQKGEHLNGTDSHLSAPRQHMNIPGEKRSQGYGSIAMDDHLLVHLPLRELNKRLRALPKAVAYSLKKRRRTLKNRKYAQNCRSKRLEQKSEMEIENTYLKEEMTELRKKIDELQRENYLLKANMNFGKGLNHPTDYNNNEVPSNKGDEKDAGEEDRKRFEQSTSPMKLNAHLTSGQSAQLKQSVSPKSSSNQQQHLINSMHSNETFHNQHQQPMMLSINKQ